jgi:hypothetical protein
MLQIPEFKNLDEFSEWYIENSMPFIPPYDGLTVETDDACTITMFRHGRYQAEMYYMKPFRELPMHCHPNVEVQIYIPDNIAHDRGGLSGKLSAGEPHGADDFGSRVKPFSMVSMQKWDDGIEMTSVAIRYKGYTSGDTHDALIKQYYTNAIKHRNYADVTDC